MPTFWNNAILIFRENVQGKKKPTVKIEIPT